jgi:uncharacterized protein YbjT (DUF2867 family)
MTSRILLTGSTGTIGSQLVRQLTTAGTPFDVLPRGVRYEDADALARAFEGAETLFVLLPLVPQKVALARNVAAAARRAGVKHIVRSSGAGADAQAGFSLPRLQGTIDQLLADTGIATTFLRPSAFMQNYASWLAGMVRQGVLHGATADAPQSLVDARDIAAVAARVLQAPAPHAGQAYTLTGPQALTDSQCAEILGKVLGRTVRFQPVALEAGDESLRAMGLPAEVVDWLASLNRIVSAGYAAGVTDDVARITGRPATSFARFAADHAAAWK